MKQIVENVVLHKLVLEASTLVRQGSLILTLVHLTQGDREG